VPGDHVVRDAGQLRNQCRDRDRRFIVGLEDATDTGDLIRVRISEFNKGQPR
jgi:hypothetical protein